MASVTTKIPKPNMNNIQKKYLLKSLFQGTILGVISTTAFYFLHIKPYYEKEKEFMETYDPFADFERMRNLGLFQSCPPDDVIAEKEKRKKK